jgi:hypothetical protein
MERKLTHWGVGISVGILVLALGAVYQGHLPGDTESKPARTCPHHMQLGSQCQMEIASMFFTNHLEGPLFLRRIPDSERQEYRFAVVTLKITKPAGASLSLAAADLTLHYYHGAEMEVAPCEGLSWFKSDAGLDVPILMSLIPGPGFIKQTTDPACTSGTIVYIDAVFGYMEPDTRECWICLGHPATTEPFVCPAPAWKTDDGVQETVLEPPIRLPDAKC